MDMEKLKFWICKRILKYITTQWLITHILGFRKTNVNKKEASNCSNIKYFISVPVTIYSARREHSLGFCEGGEDPIWSMAAGYG